ncbi:carboxypeptidase M32 [Halobaculum sp. MBLA0147]|uniref:carboxypeptidase M32 n=1 Tax=Halobaculum sp. MBLA0147 TaxID=3079934 RepID=UPI00352553DD
MSTDDPETDAADPTDTETTDAPTDPSAAYEELLDHYRRATYLEDAGQVLHWDQQVTMPSGGTPARSKQSAALSTVAHETLTSPAVGEALDAIDADTGDATDTTALDEARAATVREIRRRYDRNARVPDELIERLTETGTEAQEVWQTAKAEDDFAHFAPTLERLRDLHRERAAAIDPDTPAYEVMFDDGLPHLSLDRVEEIFADLRDGLVPLIERIEREGRELPTPFRDAGPFSEAEQEALSEAALDALGYPEDRGRLDTSPHPFTAGTQFDSRVTTRYQPEDPLDALTATIHEFGHASYQLGLPQEDYGEPLGQAMGSGVHESQSRFWENHVGRTRAFWEFFLPEAKRHLDGIDDVTVDEAYAAANRIYPDNPIRVEADELTYHLHVLLRAEVGEAFVSGEIDADEIPRLWNERHEEYLGFAPETDTEGCLQDIHWSGGFAAFHGYTVGSVLAAQLDHAMRRELDVDGLIRDGEFQPLWDWLTEHVHAHGRRYTTDELVERATGEPLTAEYFLAYAEEKFEALYGL